MRRSRIWRGPTALALLLAMLSWPLVALSLEAVQAPLGVHLVSGAKAVLGMSGAPGAEVVRLPYTDLGRWSAAFGAVLAAALIAGMIGGLVVRRHAFVGGLLTFLLAWEVAVIALPLLPSVLKLDVAVNYGYYCGDSCGYGVAIQSTDPASGLQLVTNAWLLLLLPIQWGYEPVPFGLLLLGVVAWTGLLRFSARASGTTRQVRPGVQPAAGDLPSGGT